jgi:hypothetical protein
MEQQTYGEWMRSNPPIPNITAVEWLLNELVRVGYFEDTVPNITFEQAKAMEKEQMYQVWKTSEEWSDGKLLDSKKSFEEYYNETYEKV